MSHITPAVLPSSRTDLLAKLDLLAHIERVSRIQIDVVDTSVARKPSWPYTTPEPYEAVQTIELPHPHRIEYEIDLMCSDPLEASHEWLNRGATSLIFHESNPASLKALVEEAQKRFGHIVAYGIALGVEDSLHLVGVVEPLISFVQCMGISTIGVQGQPFDKRVFATVAAIAARYPEIPIQVDGGVSLENGDALLAKGASTLVVGSALLRSPDVEKTFTAFEALVNPYGV